MESFNMKLSPMAANAPAKRNGAAQQRAAKTAPLIPRVRRTRPKKDFPGMALLAGGVVQHSCCPVFVV